MYPNTNISFAISPHSMVGKLFIENKYYKGTIDESEVEDPLLKFEAGKEFIENMITLHPYKLGSNWFNLPSLESLIVGIDKKYRRGKHLKLDIESIPIGEEIIIKCESA